MKKILTIILDGFGISDSDNGNAIKDASLKNFEDFFNGYPHALLEASGPAVGLQEGEFGNSEVGHTLIGAGRYLKQNAELVTDFLEEEYKENESFNKIIENKEKTFHLVGLCSDGRVHADVNHFLKLYDILVETGVTKINFHLITDGRDTAPTDAIRFIELVQEKINEKNIGKIATVCGRYYAMDRDDNVERTKSYYNLLVNGIGVGETNLVHGIKTNYAKGITDEFIKPIITDINATIKDGDIVFWMNYRNDRAKQIVGALSNNKYDLFPTKTFENLQVCSFMPVDKKCKNIYFFVKKEIKNPLGLYFADLNLTQARIAESEKYAHVTYFFDGGYEGKVEGCTKHEVSSPNVSTYDMLPEMSSVSVTKKVVKAMEDDVDFILVNYANPDMVGHTGNIDATIKGCMAVDICLGKLLEIADDHFYKVILLSDHGNADKMLEDDGTVCKTHSMSKVPFIIRDNNIELESEGTIINVAPTILDYMDIALPQEMQETESLLINK
ncbi:MAG: 2,3-bisphosphoglycerate-independent phosphoglycerate mutase [bacterium]